MFASSRLSVCLLLTSCLVVSVAHAQKASVPAAAAAPAPALEVGESGDIARSTEKSVPVPQSKTDREIASRLRKIYQITGWFESLKVTSQDGVVTLEGKVAQQSQRDWAINLAQDADGVVAVINKVDLKDLGWFDLDPAKKELKSFWRNTFSFVPHLVIGLGILLISILLFRGFAALNQRFWANRLGSTILADMLSKVGALPVLLVGLYLVLQVLGLTGLAFTVMGGTGALGLIAGFAFKNILENYFSGVMLSIRRPFIAGDVIEVAGYKGVVSKMTTRGTTLVNFDGDHILIPNSIIFTSVIKNQTASPLTRVHMTVEVSDGESPEILRANVLKYLSKRPEIVADPKTEVLVEHSGKSATVEAYFWINVRETSAEKLKSLLTSKIKAGLGEDSNSTLHSSEMHAPETSTKNEATELLKHTTVPEPAGEKPERNLALGARSI